MIQNNEIMIVCSHHLPIIIIIIIIITECKLTSEGKYISAMYNQSQGNTQYTIIRTQAKYKVYRARDPKDTQSTWKSEQKLRQPGLTIGSTKDKNRTKLGAEGVIQ